MRSGGTPANSAQTDSMEASATRALADKAASWPNTARNCWRKPASRTSCGTWGVTGRASSAVMVAASISALRQFARADAWASVAAVRAAVAKARASVADAKDPGVCSLVHGRLEADRRRS